MVNKKFNIFFCIVKMIDNDTYYQRNKETLKEQALNCYCQQGCKEKIK